MSSILDKEIKVPLIDALAVECLMQHYGIKGKIVIYNSTTAIIKFSNTSEYLIFVLRDVLGKAKELKLQPDFDFMIRLEKKLRTYRKEDEYYIRRKLKKE